MPGSVSFAQNDAGKFKSLTLDSSQHLKTTDIDVKAELVAVKSATQNSETALNNISVNMYNGVQQAKIMGIGDDGANKQVKTDNSGNVSAFLVSDVVMKPSNITNGDHASFSGSSVASMLRGRTDINDNSTGVFLKSESNGFLNVKAESQKTTGEWLASGSLADDAYSTALDCSNFKHIRLFGKWTGSTVNMPLMVSQTSGGTYYALSQQEWITQVSVDIGGSTEYHIEAVVECCGNFISVYNQSGTAKTLQIDYVGISN